MIRLATDQMFATIGNFMPYAAAQRFSQSLAMAEVASLPQPEAILMRRYVRRIEVSMERLDDEIYEAAVNGLDKRVRCLEWCREQVPRWLAEGEERGRRLRAVRDGA